METCNTVFTYVFIVEMVFKLIALGIKNYVVDPMNIFDGTIVLFSIADLMFLSGGNKAFSAFRSVRIFRYRSIPFYKQTKLTIRYKQSFFAFLKDISCITCNQATTFSILYEDHNQCSFPFRFFICECSLAIVSLHLHIRVVRMVNLLREIKLSK